MTLGLLPEDFGLLILHSQGNEALSLPPGQYLGIFTIALFAIRSSSTLHASHALSTFTLLLGHNLQKEMTEDTAIALRGAVLLLLGRVNGRFKDIVA